MFLELDIHQPHLDFKILDEKTNKVIPRTFCLQLLNKKSIYDNETNKIYPDLNPTATQEPQTYRLNKLSGTEGYLLDEIEACRWQAKKKKRFNKIVGIVDTGLVTSSSITGSTFIPVFASGVGLPTDAALGRFGVILSL